MSRVGEYMDDNIKVISVLQTIKGSAHRAFCYTLNKSLLRVKIKFEYSDISHFNNQLDDYKIVVIEDINLTVTCITNDNKIIKFENMDFYYGLLDIVSSYMKEQHRLTQESFHQECRVMQLYSQPLSRRNIEIRLGLDDISGRIKRLKPLKVINKKDFSDKLKNIEGSFVWAILKSFESYVLSLVFWDNEEVFGVMLDDTCILPLKLNNNTYMKLRGEFL